MVSGNWPASGSYVDLAGHGRRDQGGAEFPQAFDGFVALGYEGIDFGSSAVEERSNSALFRLRRLWHNGTF